MILDEGSGLSACFCPCVSRNAVSLGRGVAEVTPVAFGQLCAEFS